MKNVFVFPGQGAQKKGMLKEFCETHPEAMNVVQDAERISGEPVSRYLWETEDQELARSDRSQLAITTASLAIVKTLEAKGITPDICAGFSLGEYAALYAAGVLSFEDTIRAVQQRGIIMQQVCDELAAQSDGRLPGMAAVIGLTPEQVAAAVAPLTVQGICYPANLNSPKQTVVSGTAEGIEQAAELCKAAGCRRYVPLKVAGPFHSPLMEKAGKAFETVLSGLTFHDPKARLFSNVTGKEMTSAADAQKLAVLHFTHPVCWVQEEKEIAALIDESWHMYETGPGTVLSGLWRDSGYAGITCQPITNDMEILK